jgi:uncharacterized protein (TIGR03083 family)
MLTMTEPVIDMLADEWKAISELCWPLTDAQWDRASDLPGWSVKDNVAHMIGTERMLAGDEAPPVPEGDLPHIRNDIGKFNEAWIAPRRALPGPEVIAEFDTITTARLDTLRAMSTEDFDKLGFTPEGEAPYRRFMEIRVFDCWMHEQDIRRAIDQPGGWDGAAATQSIDHLRSGLGYAVGKRGGAPDGSSIVFDITGPIQRRLAVVVDGRAAVVDDIPADPTVRLTMDAETYMALMGGRWSGPDARSEGMVTIEGDTALGEQIVDHLAFTI